MTRYKELPQPYFYLPFGQSYVSYMKLAVEAEGDAAGLAKPVEAEIRATRAGLPLPTIETLSSLLAQSGSGRRSRTSISVSLGLLALLLCTVGLYGVISFVAARRTREIGIRMALGASRSQALALVLRRGLLLASGGLAIGLAGSLGAVRFIESLLYGVSARDPLSILSVAALFALVALAASYFPARRASRLDPASVMRYE